jgi:hypothetical protein
VQFLGEEPVRDSNRAGTPFGMLNFVYQLIVFFKPQISFSKNILKN